jgi:hypothetical protein
MLHADATLRVTDRRTCCTCQLMPHAITLPHAIDAHMPHAATSFHYCHTATSPLLPHATCHIQATCHMLAMLHVTCHMPHHIDMPHATRHTQHAGYMLTDATLHCQRWRCFHMPQPHTPLPPHATCYMPHATCHTCQCHMPHATLRSHKATCVTCHIQRYYAAGMPLMPHAG